MQNHFPTVVVKTAYQNETRAQLCSNMFTKYFLATISVQLWIGFKINYHNNQQQMMFFRIWSVRNSTGIELNEWKYFQNGNGAEVCYSIFSLIPLVGQFTISSKHFFLDN